MSKIYKKLNTMANAGIWFNRIPCENKRDYYWASMFEGRQVVKGAVFWLCVRNTWKYLNSLKQQV